MENLRNPAGSQYNHWRGRLDADDVDLGRRIGPMLGVDTDEWMLLHLVVFISGGTQVITTYGVARDRSIPEVAAEANKSGKLELTKLTETWQDIDAHSDTNPPRPPLSPITWVGDLLTYGFKRLTLTIEYQGDQFADHVEYVEVDSVVEGDE